VLLPREHIQQNRQELVHHSHKSERSRANHSPA
jgi:hypothetical protein